VSSMLAIWFPPTATQCPIIHSQNIFDISTLETYYLNFIASQLYTQKWLWCSESVYLHAVLLDLKLWLETRNKSSPARITHRHFVFFMWRKAFDKSKWRELFIRGGCELYQDVQYLLYTPVKGVDGCVWGWGGIARLCTLTTPRLI